MKCTGCEGSGTIAQTQTCQICNGCGYIDESLQCPDCSGSGYIAGGDCRDCDGTGSVNDEQCSRCGGSGKEADRRCDRCEATGQITQRRDCQAQVEVQAACSACGGTGQIPDPAEGGDLAYDDDDAGGGGSAAGAGGRARRPSIRRKVPGICTLYIIDQDASAERVNSVPLVQTQEFLTGSKNECEAFAAKTDRCIKWHWQPSPIIVPGNVYPPDP